MKKRWWISAATGATVLGTLALAGANRAAQAPGEPETPAVAPPDVQPIAFPHDVHAGQFRIDCQYCHFSAERSVAAGIPPVSACMGCHQLIAGRNNPEEVAKLRGYWERGEAIPWVRIYKVSDHVHFPHMRHVAAEVDCTTCHGPVTEIGVIQGVAQRLSMGWCIDCHVELGASRECTVCHY